MKEFEYRKIAQPYQTVDICPRDTNFIRQALAIYDECLGLNYISPKALLKCILSPEKNIVIGSETNGQLLGAMISIRPNNHEIEEYKSVLKSHNVSLDLSQFNLGLIKSVAVEPSFRHRGIGTKLTITAMQRLAEMSCDAFLAISWVSNRPDSSQPMFEKLGYKNILNIPDYWTEDSIKEGYKCPTDGNPCHCEAIYYFKTLK